jgi:Xaa-Pro aminopeptidase
MESIDVLARLVAQYSSHPANEVEALIERVAETPSSQWRDDWLELLFPGLPHDAATELRAGMAKIARPVTAGSGRIAAIRSLFDNLGIDGLIIPQADEYRSSSIPAYACRLQWLTGFSGSAGTAVVMQDAAWLFVDGRYILQAEGEVDRSEIEPRHFRKPPMLEFLTAVLPTGTRLGYDPRLHSLNEIAAIEQALGPAGIALVPVAQNPIDVRWTERPPPPFSAIVPYDDQFSGQAASDKRQQLADAIKQSGAQAFVVNQLESIAWLFNIRAGDATFSPVVQSTAIIHDDGHAEFFVEQEKLTASAIQHLGNQTTIQDIHEFDGALKAAGARGLTVAVDGDNATGRINLALTSAGARVIKIADPILTARMKKNPIELANLRNAMARDGAAMTRFMRWLSELPLDNLPDELEIAERVTDFRAQDELFRGPSFAPIVGIGPNGAVIHYHPTQRTNRRLEAGTLLLLDSGGQYLTGTTDITRTMCVGPAELFERQMFTTVLRSHIALAVARFPEGTSGSQLDGIARAPLWQAGVNFDHGTGHGIGSYLSVHEGPIRIAPGGEKPLHNHLVISNEPGAYFPGRFGIRIENALVVTEGAKGPGGEDFLQFETVTVAPLQRDLIVLDMLTADERTWVDNYHVMVRQQIGPWLDDRDLAWLEAATEKLAG